MITFLCKTYVHSCGYKQDFEPTLEKMAAAGFTGTLCPSCGKGPLSLETDPTKMQTMSLNEVLTPKAVIDAYRAEYEYVP